jgi:Raf kinase inhibitor-like YbhB/YbcL family protein
MRALAVLAAVVALALVGCSNDDHSSSTTTSALRANAATIALTSTAFSEQGLIPRVYSCDGANQSPPLAWTGVPAGSAELVLTVEDPDAPNGTFVHWLLYGLEPSVTTLAAGSDGGGQGGLNSTGKRGYTGPCPPRGSQHRYVFTISALRHASGLPDGASAAEVRAALTSDAVAGQGKLTGLYGR